VLIVLRVNCSEEGIDLVFYILIESEESDSICFTDGVHVDEKLPELLLIKYAIAVHVLFLEFAREFTEEAFVLGQLIIEHYLDELAVSDFALKSDLLLLGHFLLSRKFSLWLDAD
jgi:hypothetical protein